MVEDLLEGKWYPVTEPGYFEGDKLAMRFVNSTQDLGSEQIMTLEDIEALPEDEFFDDGRSLAIAKLQAAHN